MFEKKNFVVNCEFCDARKVKAEGLEGYERIVINADVLFVTEKSREILNSLPTMCNVNQTIVVENEETRILHIGVDYEIDGNTQVEEPTFLIVGGNLAVEAGSEEVLKKYERIFVNGSLRYPLSMKPWISKILVEGEVDCVPDECILLKPEFTVDRYFPVRAKEGAAYYVGRKLMLTDPEADLEQLAAKKVRFVTRRAICPEERMAQALLLVDDQVELTVVPTGYSYAGQDTVLDEALLRKYGACLFIDGSLTLNRESTPLFDRIEKLYVSGEVKLLKSQKEAFLKLDAEYGQVRVVKGRELQNAVSFTLDQAILKAVPDGIYIDNCARLTIREDVTPEEILELLEIGNCAYVKCSPNQRGAVELVCQNVASIRDGEGGEDDKGFLDIKKEAKEALKASSRIVNADSYVL